MANWTKLEGVNFCLKRCGIRPVAALDTNGTSEAADVERILDEETRARQIGGVFDNVSRCVALNPANSSGFIPVPTNTLAIKSAGPNQHRNFAIRTNVTLQDLFDLDKNTFSFTIGEVIYVDLTVQIDFANASPGLQLMILDASTQIYQRLFSGSPIKDEMLAGDRLRSEANLDRSGGRAETAHDNPPPFAPQPQRGQGR